MKNIDIILYIISLVLFAAAGTPGNNHGWKFEWIAAALLVLTLLV